MNLLVVLPYSRSDAERALDLLNWIGELGQNPGYPILLLADDRVETTMRVAIKNAAEKAFDRVYRKLAHVDSIYPQAANDMFGIASRQVYEQFKLPFLWLEPDCVPLAEGWINTLATEYFWSAKHFMGPIVEAEEPNPEFRHLNGVSIYPQDAFMRLAAIEAFKGPAAWDMASADYSVERATDTQLISQFWGNNELPPTFVDRKRTTADAPNVVNTKLISDKAVLFHRCKDASLINILRKRLAAGTPLIEPGNKGYTVPPRKPAVATPPPAPVPVPEIGTLEVT